jgi:general stress protein YciG
VALAAGGNPRGFCFDTSKLAVYNDSMNKVAKYLAEIGKRGGTATKQKYGHDHYKTIGRMGGRPVDPNSARQQRLKKHTINSGPIGPNAQLVAH